MYIISGSTCFQTACLEKFGVESHYQSQSIYIFICSGKSITLSISPTPSHDSCVSRCYIFKVNCPVFGQSIIVALSGGYILYYIFLVYLAGMKNVATTACVSCTVLITNGKRKSTEQTCVFTLYLLNCCPIVTLYSLVPRPLLLLPSVCVHNNTRKWSSAPVYYCER